MAQETQTETAQPAQSRQRLAPELALLLACARWPQNEDDRTEIRELFEPPPDLQPLNFQPLDLDRFFRLTEHHRLVPLVARNLRESVHADSLPEDRRELLQRLQRLASTNTYHSLRSLAELRRILQEFTAAGIPVRVLKGIPLAQMVYGDLSLRGLGDLDLLIPESGILEADRILQNFGYQGLFQVRHFSAKRLAFYRTHWKDIAYENPATGFEVDLHWRCFRNSEMPGGDLCAAAGGETIAFGNMQITTLPSRETLLYLCVHGTLDGWPYLKSLADVGAWVRTLPEAELDAVARLGAKYGVLPELTAALVLCRRYFGMEHWSSALLPESDPTVAHILRFAHRSLEGTGFLGGREAISPSSMMAFELGLRRSFRYRMELLLRVLFRARMWQTIPLPDYLFGMYPLLSPFEWIVFRVRQWMAKPPTRVGMSI